MVLTMRGLLFPVEKSYDSASVSKPLSSLLKIAPWLLHITTKVLYRSTTRDDMVILSIVDLNNGFACIWRNGEIIQSYAKLTWKVAIWLAFTRCLEHLLYLYFSTLQRHSNYNFEFCTPAHMLQLIFENYIVLLLRDYAAGFVDLRSRFVDRDLGRGETFCIWIGIDWTTSSFWQYPRLDTQTR